MNIPATNQTSEEVTLAGEKIKAGTQVSIREEIITQEEITEIKESGAVLSRKLSGFFVKEADEDTQDGEKKDVVHVTYPKELINAKGNLSGSNAVKAAIAGLKETHENLLSDNEFIAEYPLGNPDEYRVEVENAE